MMPLSQMPKVSADGQPNPSGIRARSSRKGQFHNFHWQDSNLGGGEIGQQFNIPSQKNLDKFLAEPKLGNNKMLKLCLKRLGYKCIATHLRSPIYL